MANSVKLTLIVFFLYLIPNQARSQGVSFSYLIPTNGYISAPVSPFSLRGIGLEFGDYLGVTTGGTLYYMSGLSMEDLPFANDKPFTGPHFSVLVPAQLTFDYLVNWWKQSSMEEVLVSGTSILD